MAAHVIVAGLEPLGLAIVQSLRTAGAEVCAIVTPSEAQQYSHELKRLGARFITGCAKSTGELLAAGLESAEAMVLTADNDAENVDAALIARKLRSDIPLVVRLFDSTLESYLGKTLEYVSVLSISGITAPIFTEIALRALAEPTRENSPRSSASRTKRTYRSKIIRIDRVLASMLVGLTLLIVLSTMYFASTLNLRVFDALYFVLTTVTTVGYGDIALRDASDAAKVIGMVLMLGGASFLAVLFALFTDAVVARRMDALQGRIAVRGRGQVLIIGGGNVGFRTARMLAERGHRVVIVERCGDIRNVTDLRALGHHVIVADALVSDTLDLAGVDNASVVLALTNSDATNLHIALTVRERNAAVPVVARLDSPELSTHVSNHREAFTASSIAIASSEFARVALAACQRV